jgi:putative FmdB family regulatory protein
MPVYEYRCESCGLEFEKLQHFSDPPVEKCEKCGGPVKKLISRSAFVLKGTGWYVTDYAHKGQAGRDSRQEKPAPPAAESVSSDTTAGKSDTGSPEKKSKPKGSSASKAAAA